MDHDPFDEEALRYAELFLTRAQREIELLAVFGSAPRMAWPYLRDMGVTVDWFADEDTRCLFTLFERAACHEDGPPPTPAHLYARGRAMLKGTGLWDESNRLPASFATSHIGAFALAVLRLVQHRSAVE